MRNQRPFIKAKKLNANALFIVVTISIVVGIILSGLLLTAGVYSKSTINLEVQNKLIHNSKSGLQYCLASSEIENNKLIDLFGRSKDSIHIKSKRFGLFQAIRITSFHGTDSIPLSSIVASRSNVKTKTALYLCNSNATIGVCGSTLINGDVFVPERGVTRSYIEGQNFAGTKLYNGSKQISSSQLPPLHPTIISSINNIYDLQAEINPLPETDTIIGRNVKNHYYEENEIILTKFISGNIVIESNSKIVVTKDAQLSFVILKAPTVIFESGFKGDVQVFATDSIKTGESCLFNYPSVFVVKKIEGSDYNPTIHLQESNEFYGNMILLQDNFSLKNNGIITLDKECLFTGEIYSKGYLQLRKCDIRGTVYAKKLYLKTNSSVYENTLLNVKIDPSKKDSVSIDLGINNEERGWVKLK